MAKMGATTYKILLASCPGKAVLVLADKEQMKPFPA
jgi:hypothetical protein